MLRREQLRPDQVEAIDWLKYRTEAFVLLPIGFGKTVVTLTALKEICDVSSHPARTLVVSTKNIVEHTWRDEIAAWEHLDFSYQSAAGRRREAVEAKPDVLGINFESLEWLLDLCDDDPALLPEMLVIDESSKMKSHSANRVKRLAGFGRRKPGEPRPRAGQARGYVHRFRRRFALSATPAPEGYTGLWAQEACISLRRRLGKNITAFRNEYCTPHWNGVVNTYSCSKEQERRIEEVLAPISYVPENKKYMDLPDPIFSEIEVPWEPNARAEYEQMEDDFVLRVEASDGDELDHGELDSEDSYTGSGVVDASSVAVQLNKLRQVCSGFVYDGEGRARDLSDPGAKLRALEAIVERSAESPILVFTQFKHEAASIGRHFRDAVLGVPDSLDDWNRGAVPMLVLHPRSAGHGLNLQRGGCHIAVFYSLPWSYEDYNQAWGRLHRGGQDRQVSVIRLTRPQSVDWDVYNKIMTKERRLNRFLQSMRERRGSRDST